jgi:small subunit ribosomal protein S20
MLEFEKSNLTKIKITMPIIKSAKKKVRVGKRNLAQNLRYKEAMQKAVKAYYKEKDTKKKEKKLSLAFSAIDKMVKINLIHKNKAARLKSSLVKNPEKRIIKKRRGTKKSRRISRKKK